MRRHRYSEQPEAYEYLLTEKGRDLAPALIALTAWGDRWAGPRRVTRPLPPQRVRFRRPQRGRVLGLWPAPRSLRDRRPSRTRHAGRSGAAHGRAPRRPIVDANGPSRVGEGPFACPAQATWRRRVTSAPATVVTTTQPTSIHGGLASRPGPGPAKHRVVRVDLRRDLRLEHVAAPASRPARSGTGRSAPPGRSPAPRRRPAPITANAAPGTRPPSPSPTACAVPGRVAAEVDGEHRRRRRRRRRAASTAPSSPTATPFAASTRPRCGTSRNVVCTVRCVHSPAVDEHPEGEQHQRGEDARSRRSARTRRAMASPPSARQQPWRPSGRTTAAPASDLPERVDRDLRISSPHQRRAATAPVARTTGRGGGSQDGRSWQCPSGAVAGVSGGGHAAVVSWKKRSSRPRSIGRRSTSTWPPAAATAPTCDGSVPGTTRTPSDAVLDVEPGGRQVAGRARPGRRPDGRPVAAEQLGDRPVGDDPARCRSPAAGRPCARPRRAGGWTAAPCRRGPRGPRSRSRIHRMPSGSRPLAGSSKISTGGSASSAPAIPSRCRMPSE